MPTICHNVHCCGYAEFLLLFLFSAVRENRTRGGRNKFGPIYRRDRALRRQLQMQRLHTEGQSTASCLTDKLFSHDFAHQSHEVDVKPTPAELASLTAQNQCPSSLPKDFMSSRQQMWREKHHGGSCSATKDFHQMSFPLSGRQIGGETVDPFCQRYIENAAAMAAENTFSQHFAADRNQTSRPSFFHRQQAYRPPDDSWQYPSAPPVSSYEFAPLPSCEPSGPVSVNYSSGFSQNTCSEFPGKPPAERWHYLQQDDDTGSTRQCSTSNVTVSHYLTDASHEQGIYLYHHRHHRRHPPYSHYHHQQQRTNQQQHQTPIPNSQPQCPKVKQAQQDEQVIGDSASPEFISEADIAAQRLPGALKLINDLQRHDSRLHSSIDQLRCYADELLEQLHKSMIGNDETGTSLELDSTVVVRQMIVIACQLCDQALFVLVEWARHAHFFRQLSVSSLLLSSITLCCNIL